ncbi:hypothetical protein DL93DRAFT_2098697 [Clavulina sp. PMI_390]|nr:hypothetical protein DL93DRAFT_2098697 [Clavulina sp. PMI_390]
MAIYAYGPIPAFVHFCIFVAFLLLLLVTLSTPIINSITLMRANVKIGVSFLSVKDSINFGVWGYCLSDGSVNFFGLNPSVGGACTKPALGYSTEFANNSHVKNLLHGTVAKGLIVFPLATAFAFVALASSIAAHFLTHSRHDTYLDTRPASRSARVLSAVEMLSLIFAGIFADLSFIIAIVVAAKAHAAASDSDGLISISYGPGVWMALVAAILLWFAKVAACCVIGRRRKARAAEKY